MLELLKGLTQQKLISSKSQFSSHSHLLHSKYAIRDFREVTMLNAEKLKKRFYIFLIFYVLFGIALSSILDRELSSDFKQKYKIILFVIEVFFMNLPMLLALVINNYIAKKTKNVEK